MRNYWQDSGSFDVGSFYGLTFIKSAPKAIALSSAALDVGSFQQVTAEGELQPDLLQVRSDRGNVVVSDTAGQEFTYSVYDVNFDPRFGLMYLCYQPQWMPDAGEEANDDGVDFVSENDAPASAYSFDGIEPEPKEATGSVHTGESYEAEVVTVYYTDRNELTFTHVTDAWIDADFGLVLEDVYDRLIFVGFGYSHFITEKQRYPIL